MDVGCLTMILAYFIMITILNVQSTNNFILADLLCKAVPPIFSAKMFLGSNPPKFSAAKV